MSSAVWSYLCIAWKHHIVLFESTYCVGTTSACGLFLSDYADYTGNAHMSVDICWRCTASVAQHDHRASNICHDKKHHSIQNTNKMHQIYCKSPNDKPLCAVILLKTEFKKSNAVITTVFHFLFRKKYNTNTE